MAIIGVDSQPGGGSGPGGGEANDGINIGTGVGIYASKALTTLQFYSLLGGTDIGISQSGNEVTIEYTGSAGGIPDAPNDGALYVRQSEAWAALNTSSTGAGEALTNGDTGSTLLFKSLVAGSGIDITSSGTEVTITNPTAHSQAHDFYGPDHLGLDSGGTPAARDLLAFNGFGWSLDRRINWVSGGYVPATWYEVDDMILDGAWTAIANTRTQERPAPQPTGEPYVPGDSAIWTYPFLVDTGAGISWTQTFDVASGFAMTGVALEVPIENVGLSHELAMFIDGVVQGQIFFNPDADGKNVIPIDSELVLTGQQITLTVTVTNPVGNTRVYYPNEANTFTGYSTTEIGAVSGSLNGGAADTDSYGILLTVQPATISNDWDIISAPSSNLGGGGGGGGSGDVLGPASAVVDNLAAFDNVNGKVIKDSGLSLSALANTSGTNTGDQTTSGIGAINVTNGTTDPEISVDTFGGATVPGIVPDPGTQTNLFLRDDGTWQQPPTGSGGQVDSVVAGTGVAVSGTAVDPIVSTIPFVSQPSPVEGHVVGNTSVAGQYLKDDGTWDDPAGGTGGQVDSIVAGDGVKVDATTPADPVVALAINAYFDRYKAPGEAIWLSGFGQSILSPFPVNDGSAKPFSNKVFDYGSDGTGVPGDWNNPSFKVLDTGAPENSDYSSSIPYTGHPGDADDGAGGRTHRSSIMQGMAMSLSEITGRDVYINITHNPGQGISPGQVFCVYQDNLGGGEGTGYTEFVSRIKEVQALSLANFPTVPDVHVYLSGIADLTKADPVTESQWLEFLFDIDYELQSAGVIGDHTIRAFFEYNPSQYIAELVNIYRTAADAMSLYYPTMLCQMLGFSSDGIHLAGQDQYKTGLVCGESMTQYVRNRTPGAGSRYNRSWTKEPVYTSYKGITGSPSTPPTLSGSPGEFYLDQDFGATRVWMSPKMYTDLGPSTTPSLKFEDRMQYGAFVPGRRITFQMVEETNRWATYEIVSPGVWSGGLPDVAGIDNYIEFEVVESGRGGSWGPTIDSICSVELLSNVGSASPLATTPAPRIDMSRTIPLKDFGGSRVTAGVITTEGDFDEDWSILSLDGTIDASNPDGVWTEGSIESPMVISTRGKGIRPLQQYGTSIQICDRPAGTNWGFGWAYILYPPPEKVGVLKCLLKLTGRQTTNPAPSKIYYAERETLINFHTPGKATSSVNHYKLPIQNVVDPGTAGFANADFGWVGTTGFLGRQIAGYTPTHATEGWEWLIEMEWSWLDNNIRPV